MPVEAPIIPDDAKRVADEMSMHAVAGSRGWAVFALADGRPLDHAAYPSWSAAVRAAKHDRDRYMFLELQPDGMSPREAQAVLGYARGLHDMGYRIPSPGWDAGPMASSMPARPADRRSMARQLASGRRLLPAGFTTSNLPSERKR